PSMGVVRSTSAMRPSRQRTAASPTAVSTQVVGCVVVVGATTGTVVVEASRAGIEVVVVTVVDVVLDMGVVVDVVEGVVTTPPMMPQPMASRARISAVVIAS